LHRIEQRNSPALNNAGLQFRLKFVGSFISYPSCLAGYFTWPQVALTHHVFHRWLYAAKITAVKFDLLINALPSVPGNPRSCSLKIDH
jgi:hypothetical protein